MKHEIRIHFIYVSNSNFFLDACIAVGKAIDIEKNAQFVDSFCNIFRALT